MPVPHTQYEAFHQWWDITKLQKTPAMEEKLDKFLSYRSLPRNFVLGKDICFSYGRHFPLMRIIRDHKGNIDRVILNGDRWGGNSGFGISTDTHQSWVRNAVQAAGLSHVIIPFSVLDSANVDYESITPVEVTHDRNEEIKHTWTSQGPHDLPPGFRVFRFDRYENQRRSQERIDQAIKDRQKIETEVAPLYGRAPRTITEADLNQWETHQNVVVGQDTYYRQHKWGPTAKVTILPDGRRQFDWTEHRHWLGESLVQAKVTWTAHKTCSKCRGGGNAPLSYSVICSKCGGRGIWTVRHSRKAYFLSGFDHNEPRPLYFFCELPKTAHPESVAQAYEDLKPDAVKLAEEMNRPVIRQGDIFAVPLTVTTAELRKQGAQLRHRNRQTRSKPLSKEAQAKLMRKFDVDKQHQDWIWDYADPHNSDLIKIVYIDRTNLLETNHEATDVAYMPNGTTLARGILWHSPPGREPDHIRRKLGDGKTWHLIQKNTVPIGKTR